MCHLTIKNYKIYFYLFLNEGLFTKIILYLDIHRIYSSMTSKINVVTTAIIFESKIEVKLKNVNYDGLQKNVFQSDSVRTSYKRYTKFVIMVNILERK